jgi:ribose transport system substrate-binding protein
MGSFRGSIRPICVAQITNRQCCCAADGTDGDSLLRSEHPAPPTGLRDRSPHGRAWRRVHTRSDLERARGADCAQDPTKVAFCFGTDVYRSAYLGTQALIRAMGGKGKIVHLAGLLVDPNTKLRMDAVEKAVKETNGAVTLIQHVTDTDQQEAADQKINALLGAQKDQIDSLVATAYIPSVVAAKSLRNLGDKRIKLVGIDDDKIVLDGIKDGFVAGTMAQNPYGQGYVAAYVLDLGHDAHQRRQCRYV